MRLLVVGDVHAVQAELDDCERLHKLILEALAAEKPDVLFFLGDNLNNHSVLNAEVIHFWKSCLLDYKKTGVRVLWILGNHETTGVYGSAVNALSVFSGDAVECVTTPRLWEGFLLMPYQDRAEDFVRIARSFSAKRMICHQSFQGAQFENGFYDPNGVEPTDIPQTHVISGHIHLPGVVAQVIYPGAPRWRSIADANTRRHLHVFEYEEGRVDPVMQRQIPTHTHCRPIFVVDDKPGAPVSIPMLPVGAVVEPRWHIDIYGPPEHVRVRAAELEGNGYRLRTFPDAIKVIKARESEGVAVAAQKYVQAYEPRQGVTKEALLGLAKERLPWLMT